jgi:phosphinothricin acetyltransferase
MASHLATIRSAERADLAALTDIYNHYVENSHVTFDIAPFSVEQRAEWFAHYATHGPFRLLVAEDQGEVVGYASSSPFRPKPAYRTSVETSVYLHPDAAGRGLGRALYRELLALLPQAHVHRAYAGVAVPNAASVALHLRCGFKPLGIYHEVGFKFGCYIDVEWFERNVPSEV